MKKKKRLFLDSYFDYDAVFPQEYFEVLLQELAHNHWIIYYVDGKEAAYGPYSEKELLERIAMAPFFFDEIVFVYHLVENRDKDLKDLGIRLLKIIAQQ